MTTTARVEPKHGRHFLISLPLAGGAVAHAYLMDDRQRVDVAANKLMHEVEAKLGPVITIPLALATPLTPAGVKLVRRQVRTMPSPAASLRRATKFHLTIWVMSSTDPVCEELMELH